MTDLSIKGVDESVVQRLKERAERNHRSLNGELKSIVEAAVRQPKPLTRAEIQEIQERVQALGLPAEPRSVDIIRRARDHEYDPE